MSDHHTPPAPNAAELQRAIRELERAADNNRGKAPPGSDAVAAVLERCALWLELVIAPVLESFERRNVQADAWRLLNAGMRAAQHHPHGLCDECRTPLLFVHGPNAGGVLCPQCDSEHYDELQELNAPHAQRYIDREGNMAAEPATGAELEAIKAGAAMVGARFDHQASVCRWCHEPIEGEPSGRPFCNDACDRAYARAGELERAIAERPDLFVQRAELEHGATVPAPKPTRCKCGHTKNDHLLGPIIGCGIGMTDPGCACCLGVVKADGDE